MVNLIPGANARIKQLIFEDSVRSDYLSTCERFTKGYINAFIGDMQRLITKLGIMMSEVSNGPHINYCYTSINYLCKDVLDSPGLIKTFDDLGLNQKGNQGKHTIARNVHIEMQRCVTAYNNIVNRIIDKYGLKSLEYMIVRKNRNQADSSEFSRGNRFASTSEPSFVKNTSIVRKNSNQPDSSNFPSSNRVASTPEPSFVENTSNDLLVERYIPWGMATDGTIKLKATLENGNGRYTKGLFNKKSMVNFKLRIEIENQAGLKIKSITAYLKARRGDQLEKALPTSLNSVTDFDLSTDTYRGRIEVSVVAVYKIGAFKTKQVKVNVANYF